MGSDLPLHTAWQLLRWPSCPPLQSQTTASSSLLQHSQSGSGGWSCGLGVHGVRGFLGQWSLASLGRPRFSPGLPWLCCINPVRVSPQLSTPFLSLESNPWRKSEPQHPAHTRHLSVQTASWLRSAGQLWFLTEFSLLCLARTCCCAPLWGSVSPSCPCPWGSFQVYRNFSTFTALSPRCLFCLFIFLLPFPYCFIWSLACLFGSLTSSASFQQVFCRSCSTCRCIFDVFLGRKIISMS